MPDIVLPAGASIAAFVMAVISWYGMLRNGVQYVHNDMKAADSFERDVRDMVEDLKKQQRALEEWKQQWLVCNETPESLYLHFWGDAEYQNIKIKLENMAANCMTTEKSLRKFTRLSENEWGNMAKARKGFRKFRFIWTKREYVQKLVDKMVTDMNSIVTAAKDGWQRDDLIKKEQVDFRAVYHAGVGHLLVLIAMHTRDDANALYLCCRAAEKNICAELELDIFNHSSSVHMAESSLSSSSEALPKEMHCAGIAKAAKDRCFTWNILIEKSVLRDANMVRMHIERSEAASNRCVNAPIAFTQVMEGHAEKRHITSSGICFSIAMSDRPYEWSTEPRQTLRRLLSGNAPPLYSNQDLLGTISKFRVAFELAQACLLLLRTSWFSGICSCHIQCGSFPKASAQFRYEFGIKMGIINHEAPKWGATAVDNCWCIAKHNWNVLTAPLRRLGLLLVEIVLGTPILRAASDRTGVIESITFVQGNPPDLRRPPETLDNILGRVYAVFQMSRRSEGAIRYCLSTIFPEAPTDNDMKKLLADFYVDVVAPLKDYYDELLDDYLRRRRIIGAVRGS